MPEPITLPPSTLHLGQQVEVRWIDGKTTTGVLAGVDADAMHVVAGVADTRIPYSLIDVAVRIPAVAGDRTAEPMSDERLAEIRARVARQQEFEDYLTLGDCHAHDLLGEVERLRAELAENHAAFREAHTAIDRARRELAEAAVRSQRSTETMAAAGVEITTLMAQRDRLTDPKAMADAIVAHLHPPHEWPDGPPCEGEHERAYEEAEAIIAALTGEEDDDAD